MNIHYMFLSKVREINDRLPATLKNMQQETFDAVLIRKLNSASPSIKYTTTMAKYLAPVVEWNIRHASSDIKLTISKQEIKDKNTAQNALDEINKAVKQAALNYNIDPALIMAVIRAESGFNPQAISSAGAMGLMQLMPFTARAMGVFDPFDIWQNIEGGTHYLKNMLDKFGSIPLALAAYNAGPGSVEKYNGIPPYTETQNYVKTVLKYMENYKAKSTFPIT